MYFFQTKFLEIFLKKFGSRKIGFGVYFIFINLEMIIYLTENKIMFYFCMDQSLILGLYCIFILLKFSGFSRILDRY